MVKVYLNIDRAVAIKAGLDQWGRQAIFIDLSDLNEEQRSTLAEYYHEDKQDPKGLTVDKGLSGLWNWSRPRYGQATVEALKQELDSIVEFKIKCQAGKEAEAKEATRQEAERQAEKKARIEEARLLLWDRTLSMTIRGTGNSTAIFDLFRDDTTFVLGVSRYSYKDKPTIYSVTLSGGRGVDDLSSLQPALEEAFTRHDQALAQQKAAEAAEVAENDRLRREEAIRVVAKGTKNQRDRYEAGVLPESEIYDLLKKDAFGQVKLEVFRDIESEDLDHDDHYSDDDNITVVTNDLHALTAEQFVALRVVQACLPTDCQAKVCQLTATCDNQDCNGSLECTVIRVVRKVPGWGNITQRFRCPE